jgi:hypothetical protein
MPMSMTSRKSYPQMDNTSAIVTLWKIKRYARRTLKIWWWVLDAVSTIRTRSGPFHVLDEKAHGRRTPGILNRC